MNPADPAIDRTPAATLPDDDPRRTQLHDEIHARPSPRIRLPALVVCVALDNQGITRERELEGLRALTAAQGGSTAADEPAPDEPFAAADASFLRLRLGTGSVRWERHTEFTRYTVIQALPAAASPAQPTLPPAWLAGLPGKVVAAIELLMIEDELADAQQAVARARAWFGDHPVVASRIGNDGHSLAVSDLRIRPGGLERMVVLCRPGMSATRAGRVSQRLLEIEIYRLLALRGLPAAKALGPELNTVEADLARAVSALEHEARADKDLLRDLTALAARLERATAQHDWRFSATNAYDTLVRQRVAELRESAVMGTQTLGEFMQRRLSPAMATVAATARRLDSLGTRVERTTALLRTRVDIATEEQNHALLARLTKGQALQLQLQATVEGLSIAAISYYIVSLALYAAKAAKGAGWLPIEPEMAAGLLIPLVVWAVWLGTRRIHKSLAVEHG